MKKQGYNPVKYRHSTWTTKVEEYVKILFKIVNKGIFATLK